MEMRISRIGKKIKRTLSGKETGAALTAVLAFLVLGALIITPLLGFMITGLKAGQRHVERTEEFYSADAGVQYAIWMLQHGGLLTDTGDWAPPTDVVILSLPDDDSDPLNGNINGDNVTVTIYNLLSQADLFKVESTATDVVTGSTTTAKVYLEPDVQFPPLFFHNAITGLGDITLKADVNGNVVCTGNLTLVFANPTDKDKPLEIVIDGDVTCVNFYNSNKGVVNGDVTCCVLNDAQPWIGGEFDNPKGGAVNGNVKCATFINDGVVDGDVDCWIKDPKNAGQVTGTLRTGIRPEELPDIESQWKTKEAFDQLYGSQVPRYPDTPYYDWDDNPVQITGGQSLPAINLGYNEGDPEASVERDLIISGGSALFPVTLTGTVFVTGDFDITPGTYIDMKGKTIYVWGDAYVAPLSNIIGSGSIISVGAIDFKPNLEAAGVGDNAMILHSCGEATDWTDENQNSGVLNSLYGVWGSSGSDVFAVGLGGIIIHYDGWDWSSMTGNSTVTSAQLNSVCGFASDDVYAVGEAGVIVHYDGATWTKVVHDLTSQTLNSVWCSSDNVVFAVGNEGTILWNPGSGWEEMLDDVSRPEEDLYDVCGNSSSNVYAVGELGTVLRYEGGAPTAWTRIAHNKTYRDLFGVWVSPTSDVFAVGDAGTILRHEYEGSWEWMFISAASDGINTDLNDVWGTSSENVYAVGPLGNIIRYSGDESKYWFREQSPTTVYTRDLHGVWGSSATDVFAVGKAEMDYVFVMSVESNVMLYPGDNFHGAFTGKGDINLMPGSTLEAPQGIEEPNFPRTRVMRINSYVVELG